MLRWNSLELDKVRFRFGRGSTMDVGGGDVESDGPGESSPSPDIP